MPLVDATLNIGCTSMQAAMTHASIHTATPDGTGSNASAAARQPITWATAANGDMVCTTPINFTGGTPGGPIAVLGFWSAVTAGTWRGYIATAGDTTFNSAGEATCTGFTIPGTAT